MQDEHRKMQAMRVVAQKTPIIL